MSKPLPTQNTFAGTAPPWNLTQLDGNFSNVWAALDDWGTYSVYAVDTGTVNALAVTLASGLTVAYLDGLTFDINVANGTTSTTPTLNVNALGAKTIVDSAGNALAVGSLNAGQRYRFMYDGTNFRVWNPSVLGTALAGGATYNGYQQIGSGGSVFSSLSGNFYLLGNLYYDGTNYRYLNAGSGATVVVNGSTGAVLINTAGTGTAGAVASLTTIFQASSAGATTVTQGYGPTAAALVDMTPDTGTFTLTYAGISGSPTGTARWARNGNLVGLYLPAGSGTSNATTFSASGLPAAITPARSQVVQIPDYAAANNSAAVAGAAATVNTSNTLTFYLAGSASGWTASGTKGISSFSLGGGPVTIFYLLN